MVVTQSIPLLQPVTVTDLRSKDWSSIMLTPLHVELVNDIAPLCEAAVEFASLIIVHLEHHGALHNNCIPYTPTT